LDSTNVVALVIGGVALVLLLFGERLLPGRPVALAVVLLSLLAVALGHLEKYGVKIVGDIPAGLPRLGWDNFDLSGLQHPELRQLVRLACACFLLSYIESISAARTFALKHRYDISPRQELLGLGAASLLTGLFQGYPIAGGLSQSAVNERSGARTPLSLIVASVAIACVLLFLTGFFRTLPDAVLAAVVLVAVKGLIDVRELLHIWRVSRLDFAAAAVALAGVLFMGVLDGVMVAVFASLVMLLWRESRPYVAILGRIPGTDRFSDIARHPKNESTPGVLAFRVQSSLLYFNADHVLQFVLARAKGKEGIRRVICDLSNVPYADLAGARMLQRMHQELAASNLDFKVVEAHGPVREMLRAEGLEQQLGAITSLADAIAAPTETHVN
jgi:SulP family sulfate permease